MDKAGTRNGFGYLRISDDKEGLELGVTRQNEDIVELAGREQITLARMFTDNDIGASMLTKKTRPGYTEMLRLVREGEADFILAYSNSRLTRRPYELEDLIRLHAETGVQIITKVSGQDDLSTADGRMVARIKGNVDAAEAEKISERVVRAHRQRAEAGSLGGGPRSFGWAEDRVSLDPVESALVRTGVDMILAGDTLAEVARTWNRLGATTSKGNTWNQGAVRQYLHNPKLMGIRTLRRQPVFKDGEIVRGQWEPILEAEQFDAIQAVLGHNAQRTPGSKRTRAGAYRYLLSGILRCEVCNNTMVGNPVPVEGKGLRTHNYVCRGRRTGFDHSCTVDGVKTDRMVVELVMEMMENASLPDVDLVFDGDARLTELETDRKDTLADMKSKTMSYRSGSAVLGMIDEEVDGLNAERAEWLARTIGPSFERVTPELFAGLTLGQQRAIIQQWVEAIIAAPRTVKTKTFDRSRVEVVWLPR